MNWFPVNQGGRLNGLDVEVPFWNQLGLILDFSSFIVSVYSNQQRLIVLFSFLSY